MFPDVSVAGLRPYRRDALRLALGATASAVAGIVHAQPSGATPDPVAPSEVVIATVDYGAVGEAVRDGALLAVETLNKTGGLRGHPVRLRSETLAVPGRPLREQAVAIASKLLQEEGLVAVIGHDGLDDALPAAIAYHRRDILFLAPTTTLSDLTRHGLDTVFATLPDNTDISTQTARIGFDIGLRRAVVLRDRSAESLEIGLAFRDEAALIGITVVQERSFRAESVSPREIMAGLQGQRIDHVVIVAPLPLSLALIEQAVAMDLQATCVLPQFFGLEDVRAGLGPSRTRVLLPVLRNLTAQTPAQLAWSDAYAARFHQEPTDWAMQGADCVGLLAYAADQAGSIDRRQLGSLLRLEAAYSGLAGRISFRRNGRVYTRLLAFASIRPDEVAFYMPGA
jgi:branched-chain amino acid transport system substrate-binding protein